MTVPTSTSSAPAPSSPMRRRLRQRRACCPRLRATTWSPAATTRASRLAERRWRWRSNSASIEAHAWVNIGTARAAKGEREGLDDIRRGLQIALRINSLESGRAYNNLAVSYARWGDFRAGLEVLREGLAVAERFGRAGGTFWFLAHQLIGERYVTGDWAEARRLADGVIEGGGPRSLAIAALVLRADMNLASGRQAEADADSETALA